jgi:molybdate transport system substrate-binding protein
MRGAYRPIVLAIVAVGLVGAACGDDSGGSDTLARTTEAREAVSGDITVFAAASLTAAFTEIGEALTTQYPGADVTFNFAASSELVTQIDQGAGADVYASADEANMKKLTDAGHNAAGPQVFATNSLQIIVERGNPKKIETVNDLAKSDVIYVTCPPEVPIGKYAQQVLEAAGVTVTPASLEENVKGIVTKVTLGEADAGIVYKTDVIAAGDDAGGVEIPADINVVATYPIVAVKDAPNPDGASEFVNFVLGEQGQRILASYGFTGP